MRVNTAAVAEATVDIATRDRLVMDHVGLVKALASRVAHRVPRQVEVAELMSVGVVGLIEAASRYQPSLGVPFNAFARRRIHGAMLDSLRGLDWVPRSLRRMRRDVDAAMCRLRHELQREPEAPEIAASLSIELGEYERRLDQLRSADLAVLKQGSIDGHNDLDTALDPGDCPHAQLERVELRRLLAQAIEQLPARERQVLALYYHEERTLADIGEVIGVSESRASQLRTQAIGRLRTILASALPRVSSTVSRIGVTRPLTAAKASPRPVRISRTAVPVSQIGAKIKSQYIKPTASGTVVNLSRASLKGARAPVKGQHAYATASCTLANRELRRAFRRVSQPNPRSAERQPSARLKVLLTHVIGPSR
jgi:RNA polymerase sigma factor for flagellar operon FliA